MNTQLIDGKQIALEIKDEQKKAAEALSLKGVQPGLAVILVGDNSASKVYVSNKKKACEYVGIKSFSYELPTETSEEELLELIHTLNHDKCVHGILVQLPLPKHMDEQKVIMAISPLKDVDGFHPYNVGALSIGLNGLVSCTPAGVIELLKRSNVTIQGKNCVIIGRSNIVGKPVSLLLLREHGTVTICHSKTQNLELILQQADIVVAAVGIAKFIKGHQLKEGAVVIDVGMNRDENGKLCGDVDFDSCQGIASQITPVPGGVGPMTIAMLMHNCIRATKNQEGVN
ncbi:bifunctional methylenetetrahydrofolate dehydrogenase/methenyltetrahydrofolate cyclohydrolase FolD [Sporanaerobium hydrogeniformans]|uniref:Bifunctional methylenetetrahydrofolate dehydrogenase/methenyltetrahydrofolate cyclohydrolase FolD n=1 Tax=Sporanaerobium hydrogeniformans TaxID=3072179 RepID=A0AC61DD14_9FIRM|nr:bifunctional methylenetetrahydrofolate dehydrogenase/methenyltetrahydrofolate cyclohydrolase FolD [Sporanaerobium hydrogeniformans]PHV70646.1 bifunctional methylenetetrahydrofolate dehydrogenase/methenyltetrahydrofolate cyclohydrolase FolD [Sporanaerobium hydrogeniformans]